MKSALADQVGDDFAADLAITTPAFGGGRLSPALTDQVRRLDEVDDAVGLGGGPAKVDGDTTEVVATDAAKLPGVAHIEAVDGDFADLGSDGIAVSDTKADDHGWKVGSQVDVTYVDGQTETATVRAIYGENSLLGGTVVPDSVWAEHNAQPTDRTVLVDVADGVSIDKAKTALDPLADRNSGTVQDADEMASAAGQGLDLLLGIVYVLLALAVIIALLGIRNTLALAVHERQRELGLLRAVGQTRRQVRSVLRLESVIVAVFGTVVGLALGAYLGWVLFATVWTGGGGFTLPVARLAVIALMGAIAGVLAARKPAKRAARTPVLEAIAAQ
jgi:putative ABC transport system permease protein